MNERAATFIAAFARAIAGSTIRSSGFVPDTRQRVYYANHTSHLDSVVLWSALPKKVRRITRPVAAKDYWDGSAFRRYLSTKIFNAILIERDPSKRSENPIEQMAGAMGGEYSIIIFPEGTRGTGEQLAPFKSGIFHLATKKPELEFVPVYIENLNRILPKGEIAPVPLLSSLTIGTPLKLEPGESKNDFLGRARAALEALKQT